MSFSKGFTLVELLIVIMIIGILAGVVLVNSKGAVDKAKRASALSTASSILPELVTCQDDGGYAKTTPAASAKVCCTDANCASNAFVSGHSVVWPVISTQTGWDYNGAASGTVIGGDYQFTLKLISDNTQVITCSMVANGCS
jgi:prepilin-type N-terminal cleavage/methylation domain-containing protein